MKTLANLFLFMIFLASTVSAAPILCSTTIPSPHEGNAGTGCVNGKRSDGIYYTDCYQVKMGDSSDTQRLRRMFCDISTYDNTPNAILPLATYNATSRKAIFNQAVYYVDDQLDIPSYTTVEGLSAGSEGTVGGTTVHFTGTDKVLFYIPEGSHSIAIRDMALYNEVTYDPKTQQYDFNGNTGILAEGDSVSDPNSTHFDFNNLRIKAFEKGLFIRSTNPSSGWQYDNLQIQNSTFDNNNWGVHLYSQNANLEMNNVVFNNSITVANEGKSPPFPYTQNGIWIQQAGYVVLNYIVGNGTRDGNGHNGAGEFIHIDQRSIINMNSVFGEGYKIHLKATGFTGYKFNAINITNSAFPACQDDGSYDDANPAVSFHNSTVVSSGNFWGCLGLARPIATGTSDVYSSGDKFCFDGGFGGSTCDISGTKAEWVLNSNEAVYRSDSNVPPSDLATPVTEILAGTNFGARPLLALSVHNFSATETYTYTFKRNGGDGWLDVEGNQTAPYTGFRFKNGPVQLQSVTQTNLGGYTAVAPPGSMLYCSNCIAGSSPCAATGNGALALRSTSQWDCK